MRCGPANPPSPTAARPRHRRPVARGAPRTRRGTARGDHVACTASACVGERAGSVLNLVRVSARPGPAYLRRRCARCLRRRETDGPGLDRLRRGRAYAVSSSGVAALRRLFAHHVEAAAACGRSDAAFTSTPRASIVEIFRERLDGIVPILPRARPRLIPSTSRAFASRTAVLGPGWSDANHSSHHDRW